MNENRLPELNLTTDEIKRFGDAFRDDTFKQLLSQYLLEINDPDNRAVFERETIQLEKERGNDIEFVLPRPVYALKTSVNGKEKAYVNICGNDRIDCANYVPACRNNVEGVEALIPHAVAPMQKHRRKNGSFTSIFTVIFHCATLQSASENVDLKKAVEEIAFSAVEKCFDVKLDLINYVISKRPFKGHASSTIINKKTFNAGGTVDDVSKDVPSYVEPSFKIKYRNEIDLQNSTTDRYCKMDALVPKYIIVEVDLPLLNSIQTAKLDVRSTSITFTNDKPAYKLQISLPYAVDENGGDAKFDSTKKILTLELAVAKHIKKPTSLRDTPVTEIETNGDSQASEISNASSNKCTYIAADLQFLKADLKYNLPPYYCNYHDKKLAYVFNVRNVNAGSFDYRILEKKNGFWVKFWSIGAGQYTMHYSAAVFFPSNINNVVRSLKYSVEDENVFVYVYLQSDVVPLEYRIGTDPDHTKKEYLTETDGVLAEIENKKSQSLEVDMSVSKFTSEEVIINISAKKDANEISTSENIVEKSPAFAQAIDFSTFCDDFEMKFSFDEELQCVSETEVSRRNGKTKNTKEPNSDAENRSWIVRANNAKKMKRRKKFITENELTNEHKKENQSSTEMINYNDVGIDQHSEVTDITSAYKYADLSNRSILKKNRSFSESSGDEMCQVDCFRSFSVDEINYSSDSYGQSLPKKTVTFNDTILKKLYSSDISILEQRKRSKRRTQRKERKASDSDNSETETTSSVAVKRENIRLYNETLTSTNSEPESTSLSESGGETSDGDQSDNPDRVETKLSHVPCSKKSHKRRGKKSARKNASTAKHNFHASDY